jgi:hypothetical protein
MPKEALIFGSSKDPQMPYWRVWSYDDQRNAVIPLAHFNDRARSGTAAFELAHSVGSLEDASVIEAILASKDSDPTPLPPEVAGDLTEVAEKAIRERGAPVPGKAAVTVLHLPGDTVYIVRVKK